jgi:nucleotide-binding universal stress UspA family protein
VVVADDGSEDARLAVQFLVELADPERCMVTALGVVTRVDLAAVPALDELDPVSIPMDPVEISELENTRLAIRLRTRTPHRLCATASWLSSEGGCGKSC